MERQDQRSILQTQAQIASLCCTLPDTNCHSWITESFQN